MCARLDAVRDVRRQATALQIACIIAPPLGGALPMPADVTAEAVAVRVAELSTQTTPGGKHD